MYCVFIEWRGVGGERAREDRTLHSGRREKEGRVCVCVCCLCASAWCSARECSNASAPEVSAPISSRARSRGEVELFRPGFCASAQKMYDFLMTERSAVTVAPLPPPPRPTPHQTTHKRTLPLPSHPQNKPSTTMLYKTIAFAGLALTNGLAIPTRAGNPTMQMAPAIGEVVGKVAPTGGPVAVDSAILVQGGSLRTWSYHRPRWSRSRPPSTEGRPLDADIELWHGPDNTPCKMRVYVENGQLRPFSAVIETPAAREHRRDPQHWPDRVPDRGQRRRRQRSTSRRPTASPPRRSSRAVPCAPTPSTRPSTACRSCSRRTACLLNARIELLQGPNNNKQVVELYTEDGCDRPFFCVLETPGSGNVVRIVNTAPVEFPMTAGVVPHSINQEASSSAILGGDVVIGGDMGR